MRFVVLVLASVGLAASPALATPLAASSPMLAPDARVIGIHHKPGHAGGPPWARGGLGHEQEGGPPWGRGRGMDQRDDFADVNRHARREGECMIRYERQFDPYTGAYERRPVRICRGGEGRGYGYGYR